MDGTSAMMVSLFVGLVGSAMLVYGRKQGRFPHVAAGIALIAFPFVVDDGWVTLGIAGGLLLLTAIAVKLGV